MSTVAICPHSGQVTRSVASAARVGPAETGNELADCTVTTPIRSTACGPDLGMTSVIGPVGGPNGIQASESGRFAAAASTVPLSTGPLCTVRSSTVPLSTVPLSAAAPDPSLRSVAIAFLLHRREHPPLAHPQLNPDVRGDLVTHHGGELLGRQVPGAGDGHLDPADVLRRITFPPDSATVHHFGRSAGEHLDEFTQPADGSAVGERTR